MMIWKMRRLNQTLVISIVLLQILFQNLVRNMLCFRVE